jgi:glycosyltransferase involved in cell wall biosynthesis
MFNEEEVLPLFTGRLRPILDGIGEPYEVVAVDDGSTDTTASLLTLLAHNWPQLRVVRLRRNSGHQAALMAGLHQSCGAYVASIDADLQDPPEKIAEMLDLARDQRLDIVYGVRDDRSTDTIFKRWTAALYYRVMRRIVGKRVPDNAGDFRLLSRATVDALCALPERQPVFRLLVPWLGFPSGEVRYRREARAAGRTKYPLSKMLRLAFDSIANFSAAPLKLATWLGAFAMALCVVLIGKAMVDYLSGNVIPGWTSLFVAVMFLGGAQLLCLGLLGEYVGRTYSAVQGRPAYFINTDAVESVEAETDDVVVPQQRQPLIPTGK